MMSPSREIIKDLHYTKWCEVYSNCEQYSWLPLYRNRAITYVCLFVGGTAYVFYMHFCGRISSSRAEDHAGGPILGAARTLYWDYTILPNPSPIDLNEANDHRLG